MPFFIPLSLLGLVFCFFDVLFFLVVMPARLIVIDMPWLTFRSCNFESSPVTGQDADFTVMPALLTHSRKDLGNVFLAAATRTRSFRLAGSVFSFARRFSFWTFPVFERISTFTGNKQVRSGLSSDVRLTDASSHSDVENADKSI